MGSESLWRLEEKGTDRRKSTYRGCGCVKDINKMNGVIALWLKALAAKSDDLSLSPGPTWWKEGTDSLKLSSEFPMNTSGLLHTIINKCKTIVLKG